MAQAFPINSNLTSTAHSYTSAKYKFETCAADARVSIRVIDLLVWTSGTCAIDSVIAIDAETPLWTVNLVLHTNTDTLLGERVILTAVGTGLAPVVYEKES